MMKKNDYLFSLSKNLMSLIIILQFKNTKVNKIDENH